MKQTTSSVQTLWKRLAGIQKYGLNTTRKRITGETHITPSTKHWGSIFLVDFLQAAINGFLATGHHAAPRPVADPYLTTATRRSQTGSTPRPPPFGMAGYV